MMLQASPEFKGIKTRSIVGLDFHFTLQASPEFKGIKTPDNQKEPLNPLQASPEFKGIKTKFVAW